MIDKFGRTWTREGTALATEGIRLDFGRDLSDADAQSVFVNYPPADWIDRDAERATKIEAVKAHRDALLENHPICLAAQEHIAALNACETPESYQFDSGWPDAGG